MGLVSQAQHRAQKLTRRLLQPRIRPLWWLEKQGPLFFHPKSYFQPMFDLKY